MFSFHSKYFVYRELKKAPQKLSFCFKWPDTGTVRILGNICISLILLLHIKLINHMTCISCPSQLLKYLLSLQIFSTSDICQFRWLSLHTENVLNYTNFQSWWWDWCLQLQTNFIIVKLQQYFWKNYVQQSERFHWQTHLTIFIPIRFCRAHSSEHVILDMVESIRTNMDKKQKTFFLLRVHWS